MNKQRSECKIKKFLFCHIYFSKSILMGQNENINWQA